MRAGRVIAAVAVGAAAVVAGPLAQPAGAAVTVSTSGGNTVLVNIVGDASIQPGCSSGQVTINNVVAAPAISCSAMTQLTVAGDSGNQSLYSQYLDSAEFSSHPKTVASLGDGSDLFYESRSVDNVDMGPGNDQAVLFYGGSTNIGIDLGAGTTDQVVFYGSDQDDTITVASVGAGATISQSNPDGGGTTSFANAKFLQVYGAGGDDTISSAGIALASTIDYVSLYGDAGDDTVTAGPVGTQLHGGTGANTLIGAAGHDAFWSESDADTLNGASDSDPEFIYDTDSLRSGGRTLTGFGSGDTYVTQTHQGDVVMRVRPAGSAGTQITSSLTRPGQQIVPASIGTLGIGQSYVGTPVRRGIADVVLNPMTTRATMSSTGGGILDVTVPTGSWTTTAVGQSVTVEAAAGHLDATYVTAYRVHGPWTNKAQGFAHRVTRDLMFRFATDAQRDAIRDQLTAGTKTRAQITASLMDTDEYRGLDVDRVFVKYLRRPSDPSGRTYWINALHGGRALWRFRAQLFGSNEYFTKAGGTNAAYVTKAYNDVLGRNPDPSGQTYWTNKLNSGADRGSVALQFINSAESRRRLVDDQFLRFLDRLPTASEQSTWAARIPSATGEQDFIAFLANSTSYYNRS